MRHWGPLEIDGDLYEQAVRRSEQLASGDVRYQVYDSSKPRTKRAANVVHCIDAVAETAGKLTLGTVRGFAAGEQVVEHFRSHVKHSKTPAWLYDAVVRNAQDQAQAETLAIVAYLQPVARPEIARIRGVSSESAVGSLSERGLIEEAGRSRFGAAIYRTSPLFEKVFGLDGIEALPDPSRFDPTPEDERDIRERLLAAGEQRAEQ